MTNEDKVTRWLAVACEIGIAVSAVLIIVGAIIAFVEAFA